MAWYTGILIFMLLLGILLMIFSHGANKRNMIIGLTLIFFSLLGWAFIWFESVL